jgi:hypothetical protein
MKEEVCSHLLIAIDPGKRICGVSIWGCSEEGSVLLHATSVPSLGNIKSIPVYVDGLALEFIDGFGDLPPEFVFEVPKYYMKKRATFRGVDALFEVLDAFQKHGILIKNYVYPFEWKGNMPKKVHHKRVKKALSEDEMDCVDPCGTHDMWDAIGIGLYATGRTGKGAILFN